MTLARAARLVVPALCIAYLAGTARAAALDPTFGSGGVTTSDFGAPSFADRIALQPDGKIVVAGARGTPTPPFTDRGTEFLVTRYLPSGTLDTTFAGGYATATIAQAGYPSGGTVAVGALLVRPDGRIVVAGSTWHLFRVLHYHSPATLGFTTNGAPDSSWGNAGIAWPGGGGQYTGIALQPDGKVVMAGTWGVADSLVGSFAVSRYNDNGTLDAGFGGGAGLFKMSLDYTGFALLPDGNILVAYWQDSTFSASRYLPSGTLVSTVTGQTATSNYYHQVMALQPDGKILMAGRSTTVGSAGLLARFDASGSPDSAFGTAGIVTLDVPLEAIVLQPDGKIVGVSANWELFRFNADGSFDTSFARNGRFAVAMPAESGVTSLALQADGKVVAAGWSGPVTSAKVALARVDPSVPSPAVAVAPASVDFPPQSLGTTSAPLPVTFTNNGAGPVTITDVSVLPATRFITAHDCATLAPGASCTVQVRHSPQAYSFEPGTLTFALGGEAIRVRLSGTIEGTLTRHYYRSILQREPDAAGMAFWNGEYARVYNLGSNGNETWLAMAMAFFGSAEYAALNRDNAGYVSDLYTTFYNRAPDTAGRDYWVGQLQAGLPREVALASFMLSTEFTEFIKKFYGSYTARAEVSMVFDFYRGLVRRLPDTDGFTYWISRFRQAQCQVGDTVRVVADQISGEFARSAEYAAFGRTNSQFVGDLYNAFLRRGGDLSGVQFWIGQLASGAQTREQVRAQFVASPEFTSRVTSVAGEGCLPQ